MASGTAVNLQLTTTGITGCEGIAVPDTWEAMTARRCRDTDCLSLAAFDVDDAGNGHRLAWRRLPVATSTDRVALLVDGDVVASGGSGWVRVGLTLTSPSPRDASRNRH